MNQLKCPKCSIEVGADWAWCGGCGFDLAQAPKCVKCGSFLPESCKFCSDCGHPVGMEEKNSEKPAKGPISVNLDNVIRSSVNISSDSHDTNIGEQSVYNIGKQVSISGGAHVVMGEEVDIEETLNKAHQAILSGNLLSAVKNLEKVLTKEPDNPSANLLQAITKMGGKSARKLKTAEVQEIEEILNNTSADNEYNLMGLYIRAILKLDHYNYFGKTDSGMSLNMIRSVINESPRLNDEQKRLLETIKMSDKAKSILF